MIKFQPLASLRDQRIILGFAFVIAAVINILTIKDGHNWGDDFAQYIIYARNIASGQPLTAGVMLGLDAFPIPGYSYLLSIVVLLGGSFIAFKVLNVLFWTLMVWGCFLLLSHLGGAHASRVSILLAYSCTLFFFKQNILPDIPFTCCCVWAIYFFERFRAGSGRIFFYRFLVVASLAFFFRSAGSFLFLSSVIFLLFFLRHQWIRVLEVLVTFLVLVLLQKYLSNAGISGHQWMLWSIDPWKAFLGTLSGIPNICDALLIMLLPPVTPLASSVYLFLKTVFALPLAWFLAIVAGFLNFRKNRDFSFMDCAFICYFVELSLWNGVNSHPPEIFSRYWLPVYGIFLFYIFQSVRLLSAFWVRVFTILILFLNVSGITYNFSFNDDVLLKRESVEMFTWVKEQTTSADRFMFTSPRALAVMTGREVAPIYSGQGSDLDNLMSIRKFGIKYAVLPKGQSEWFFKQRGYPMVNARPVWENEGFIIFKIL